MRGEDGIGRPPQLDDARALNRPATSLGSREIGLTESLSVLLGSRPALYMAGNGDLLNRSRPLRHIVRRRKGAHALSLVEIVGQRRCRQNFELRLAGVGAIKRT
jgi:hypothetical protein